MTDRRVCAVTGASSGIGRAVALACARRGDLVVAVGRNPERLAETAEALGTVSSAPHRVLRLDVSSEEEMSELRACLQELQRVDLLVCSAAVGRGLGGTVFPPPTAELPTESWQAMVDVNLHGVFLANMAVLPLMLARGEGDIVNIGSSTTPRGLRGTALAPAYAATKFALAEYGRRLAEEVGPDGVRVATIFPGPVETPLIADTLLDKPFGGRISDINFSEALLGLIELGGDVAMLDPHILPMPTRRRKGRPVDGH